MRICKHEDPPILMQRLFVVLLAIFVASCGNENTAVVSSNDGRAAANETLTKRRLVHYILAGAEKGQHKEGEIIVKFNQDVRMSTSMRTHKLLGSMVLRRFGQLN